MSLINFMPKKFSGGTNSTIAPTFTCVAYLEFDYADLIDTTLQNSEEMNAVKDTCSSEPGSSLRQVTEPSLAHRNKLRQILKLRGLPFHLIRVIKELYRGTCVYSDTGEENPRDDCY